MPPAPIAITEGEIVETNLGGRPFIFKTPDELAIAIADYFTECDNNIKEIHKEDGSVYGISDPVPYTMSGLANALGVDRTTVINYAGRDGYSSLIKQARRRVEQRIEENMLRSPGIVAGYIFNLKNNFGWQDKRELDHNIHLPQPLLGGSAPMLNNTNDND